MRWKDTHKEETRQAILDAAGALFRERGFATYNANAIFRDPAWRKTDKDGALRMHPEDAQAHDLADGARARVTSARGAIDVTVQRDESVRRGMVTLPHGHGMRYGDSEPLGPALNQLTSSDHCEPFTRTPYHKHVPVRVQAVAG